MLASEEPDELEEDETSSCCMRSRGNEGETCMRWRREEDEVLADDEHEEEGECERGVGRFLLKDVVRTGTGMPLAPVVREAGAMACRLVCCTFLKV